MVFLGEAVVEQVAAFGILADDDGLIIIFEVIDEVNHILAVAAEKHGVSLGDVVFLLESVVLARLDGLDGDSLAGDLALANHNSVALTFVNCLLLLVLVKLVRETLGFQDAMEYLGLELGTLEEDHPVVGGGECDLQGVPVCEVGLLFRWRSNEGDKMVRNWKQRKAERTETRLEGWKTNFLSRSRSAHFMEVVDLLVGGLGPWLRGHRSGEA